MAGLVLVLRLASARAANSGELICGNGKPGNQTLTLLAITLIVVVTFMLGLFPPPFSFVNWLQLQKPQASSHVNMLTELA